MVIEHSAKKASEEELYASEWNDSHKNLSQLPTYKVYAIASDNYIAIRDGNTLVAQGADFGAIINAIIVDAGEQGLNPEIFVKASPHSYIATTQIVVDFADFGSFRLFGFNAFQGRVGYPDTRNSVVIEPKLTTGTLFKIGNATNYILTHLEGICIMGRDPSYVARTIEIVRGKVLLRGVSQVMRNEGQAGTFLKISGYANPVVLENCQGYSSTSEDCLLVNTSSQVNTFDMKSSFMSSQYGTGIPLHIVATSQMYTSLVYEGAGFIANNALTKPCVKIDSNNVKAFTFLSHWFEYGQYGIDLSGMTSGGPINVIGCCFFNASPKFNNPNAITINELGNTP